MTEFGQRTRLACLYGTSLECSDITSKVRAGENKCGRTAILLDIELATGRVRPTADKGLLDPPKENAARASSRRVS
jgi:hypothetical protein